MRHKILAAVAALSLACGGSDPVESPGPIDITGHWLLSDSTWVEDYEAVGLKSPNICVKWDRPVTIVPEIPADSIYYAYESLGGSMRCEVDGVWLPVMNQDDFYQLAYHVRVRDGQVQFLAPNYETPVYNGTLAGPNRMSGTRTGYYDGRVGTWKMVR